MKREGPDLSLVDAGRAMGLKGSPAAIGKKAKRLIEAKERRIKRQILLRTGTNGTGVRYVVTRWALMKFMPEFFDRRDQVAIGMRKHAAKLEERLGKVETIADHLGDLLAEALDKLAALESAVQTGRKLSVT